MTKLLVITLFICLNAKASLVYTPAVFSSETARLVVVLHGCLQSAESMALGTGWNQIADRNNLVILYPQVPEGSNPLGCWSWYLPENQRADRGQLKKIKDEMVSIQNLLQIKTRKSYVVGISAGSATAAGLVSCFPTEFSAVALHSGPAYGIAQNLLEGDRVMKEGPPSVRPKTECDPTSFKGRTIVLQGLSDQKVNPRNVDQIIRDFAADARPTPTKEFVDTEMKFKVTDYFDTNGLRLRSVSIDELDHSWAGFVKNLRYGSLLTKQPTQIPFFNAKGPSSTNLIWEFFN